MMEWGGRTDGKEGGGRRRGERSLAIEITTTAPQAPPDKRNRNHRRETERIAIEYGDQITGWKIDTEGAGGKRKRMAKEAESGGKDTRRQKVSEKME